MIATPLSDGQTSRVLFSIQTRSLIRYWRLVGGVDVRGLYEGVDRIELREGENGLRFFSPMIAGDAGFYQTLYRRLGFDRFLAMERPEFRAAAAQVPPGVSVLDVGCGFGEFARWLHSVSYTGIDLSFDEVSARDLPPFAQVRRQALKDHLSEGRTYDVVSAFQVLEHVEDPEDFLKDLVHAAKPGGRIIVAVPLIPSAALEVPALPINMPPHHLTFWTMPALAHAFGKFGLKVLNHQAVPPGPAESFLFWARRFSWIRDQNGFARLDRYAVASMLAGVAMAKLLTPWLTPTLTEPVNQLIVGERG